ncbi:UDP-N-acetylmuramate/alanine ligase [Chlorobaculum parvum NCIB 8327]|uniref:UDP-N-acetylmuramate--L-alanine ligase n=1 Tax=Chlorobaculum parvum (strain DSM 263 / NCIMB 8327) TaxID=517417 RepID=MURC_CHLP8|nr:UDP-N-acetylmuramate--L-alanine ligase [Chlorobaculum parvum]B3QLW3.1 RecName: Full=UDP-N-acetylmuramate--L-alanine ligase; AltName: Full=UDP-N-acetylmuramoyl-L-alanine synthetase [Chlorobaculum parvum NCIB 8327]ACF12449.1 UDP-N-acetylmuramate/alanine ligase [Chlorobaculum parvum NCIB 8327]
MELGRTRNVHIVGIGGAGMSAIAELLLKSGFSVSGSDLASGEVIDKLRELGAVVWQGHEAEHVGMSDVVVYSSAVRPESNVEIQAAEKQGIPVIKRDEMLGELMRYKVGICVSGTHGKTTTTAMIATMLLESGQSPTVMIGGVSDYLKGSTVVGEGRHMVIEADEYDRAFLKLTPTIAVVNSLESEHMDTYGTMDNLRDSFAAFANKVPFYGRVICCVDWPEIRSLISRLNRRYTTFGIEEPADVMASDLEACEGGSVFTVEAFGESYPGVRLGVPGRHNVLNALAAFSVGLEIGLPPEKIIAGLGAYTGMRRRFQMKFKGGNGLLVVDDYAHHPSEVKATVKAARHGWKEHRIVAVFQPHLYSRTSEFAVEFGWALSRADAIYVAGIYPSRERTEDFPGVTGELVAEAARKAGAKEVTFEPDSEQLLDSLRQEAGPDTLILFMGAGDITHLATRFASMCADEGTATGAAG